MDHNKILDKVGKFAAPMLSDPNISAEEGAKIAIAFLYVSVEIFKAIGGSELAAKQLYAEADRCATTTFTNNSETEN